MAFEPGPICNWGNTLMGIRPNGGFLLASRTLNMTSAAHDVAPALGLNVTGHAGGVVMEDFDGDGLLDLMISSSGPLDQLRFLHNNGDGTFTERTREAGLLGETG